MREEFIYHRFSAEHEEVIHIANQIIQSYMSQGYDLTLRQLYYQFVARDAFPRSRGWLHETERGSGQLTHNHQRNYDKLGKIISKARMAGLIDWDSIVDRTRSPVLWSHESSPKTAIQKCRQYYQIDMWENQPRRVEVWVEKEALVSVFKRICGEYDVPVFACKGYVSSSAQYEAYRRFKSNAESGQSTTIFHFGDHDPSGIQMTEDNEDRLSLMLEKSYDVAMAADFEVRRLALNLSQVRTMDIPPAPAKLSDSRAKAYIEQFGEDSWELDALPPSELSSITENNILSIRDEDLWGQREQQQQDDLGIFDKILQDLD